jgi:vacuolar-type H+-ATPase subunit B/Vma2
MSPRDQHKASPRRQARTLAETLDLAWQVLAVLPRRELAMLPAQIRDEYYPAR